jgi:tetratricopeptide (TPR) repeat protein
MAKSKKMPPTPSEAVVPQAPVQTPFSFLGRPWLPELALAVVAVVVFGASVSNGFVFFDDDKAILYNKALQSPSLAKFFSGQNLGMYAPMTWIGYWIGSIFSGKNAWGYHLLALLLHALNAAMVWRVLNRLTGLSWVSFAAALLFAVHPVQAEAVCWAAALSTVMFSTFYLISLLAYIRWAQSDALPWLAGSLAAFVLACLSKSAAVTLPLVLIGVDFYLLNKFERKFWLSKIPYLIFSFAFGLYTFSTRAQEGHDIQAASSIYTAIDRFWMICQTMLFYPVKLLVPVGFSVAYPFVKMNGTWSWSYYIAPVILLAIAALVWMKGRDNKPLLLGLGLYLLPLSVMLPFQTVGSFELRSDRYVYLSSVGLFFLLALLLEKLKPSLRDGVLAVIVAGLGFLAFQQSEVWKDGVAMFKNCVNKTPESSLCQCNLAYNQLINLDFQGAIEHYSESLKYDPNTVEAYNGRGQAYLQLRKVPEALEDFNNAIKAGISTPKLFLNRGKCLVMLNRHKEAIPDLTHSLELEPKSAEAYYFRGVANEKTGDIPAATSDYTQALNQNPNYLEALVNRAVMLMNSSAFDDAIADYTKALALNGNMEMIWNNRAYAYYLSGNMEKGLQDINKALSINPKYARAYKTRGVIYTKMGQADKAQADFQLYEQLNGK